jgi:Uma2 family endonuclease
VVSGSGVIVSRDPDSVLAPDVAVYLGPPVAPIDEPERYEEAIPAVVFEVVSPSDFASHVEDKVALYLEAGVQSVVVVWPKRKQLTVRTARGVTSLGEEADLTFDGIPGVADGDAEIFGVARFS